MRSIAVECAENMVEGNVGADGCIAGSESRTGSWCQGWWVAYCRGRSVSAPFGGFEVCLDHIWSRGLLVLRALAAHPDEHLHTDGYGPTFDCNPIRTERAKACVHKRSEMLACVLVTTANWEFWTSGLWHHPQLRHAWSKIG